MYSTQTSTHSSLCPYLMYSTQTSTHSSLCPYLMYSTQTSTHSSLFLLTNMLHISIKSTHDLCLLVIRLNLPMVSCVRYNLIHLCAKFCELFDICSNIL